MKGTKKYLLLAIMLIILILFGIQRNVSKQQYKINSYSLAIFVDGEKKDTYPERGNYNVSVDCMGKANGSWDYNNWGPIIKNFNDGAACNIIFTTGKKFNEYIIDASKTDSNIIYMEQPDTVQTGSNAKEEYRYAGANPNNYVYFGCDSNCTEDNLYRIIGVLPTQSIEGGTYEKRVKLIKSDYYTEIESGLLLDSSVAPTNKGYYWSNLTQNDWVTSTLQTQVLNGVYWKNLGEYQTYIDSVYWYLGGALSYGTDNNYATYSANDFYGFERGSTPGAYSSTLKYKTNIGLMYVSDFGFSAEKAYNSYSINSYRNVFINSWLYKFSNVSSEKAEWTMNSSSAQETYDPYGSLAYDILSNSSLGPVYRHWIKSTKESILGVRPTFYLKENVLYQNGLGTKESPYRIMLGES